MAHHQALILLSINNLINNGVLKDRFYKNPEIEAVDILLQEKMPRNIVITKTKKEKVEKLKYKDTADFPERVITKLNPMYENTNIISNDNYTVFLNDKGEGYSKYQDIYINRYKKTSEENQGIKFYIKSKNKIWSSILKNTAKLPTNYTVTFNEAESDFERLDNNILTKLKVTVSPEDNVEIRTFIFKNLGKDKEELEINSILEPVLSTAHQDYAHPSFNSMSLEFDKHAENILVKRRMKSVEEENLFLAVTLYSENNQFRNLEFEIDKKKIMGRNNDDIPEIILNSLNESGDVELASKIELTVNPMLLLRKKVEIEAESSLEVSYIMAFSDNKERVLNLIEKYKNSDKIKEVFELQKAKVEAENRYLMLNSKNIVDYQEILRELLYKNYFKKNNLYNLPQGFEDKIYLKENLWKFGISGDLPYILVKIKNDLDIDILGEVLKAYEYFKLKNIRVDLVIVNEEEYSYEEKLRNLIDYEIQNNQIAYMINNGIYVLSNLEKEDLDVLEFRSNFVINASKGNLSTILKEQKQEYLEYQKYWNSNDINNKKLPSALSSSLLLDGNLNVEIAKTDFLDNLKFCNEYGGFTQNGKEYHISINKNKKLPMVWSNVLANKNFGTVVTETAGGYTWCKNSRLNRLTAWNNNAILDTPSEIIYLKDMESLDYWTLGYSVMPKNIEYNIIYGFGYVLYKQIYNDILQENQVYVPVSDNIKVNYINIRNLANKPKKLKILYYIKPVLGEDEIETNSSIYTNLDTNNNIVSFKNLGNTFNIENVRDSSDKKNISNTNIAYISSSEKIVAYTGSKKSFIGVGNIANPEAIISNNTDVLLDNQNSLYEESAIVLEINVELNEYENKEITLILGEENSYDKVIEVKNRYSNIEEAKQELDNVKRYWNDKLNRVQVKTPDEVTNIMLNGWCAYQTLVSRIYGKTGYYQSGGAIGFRDQLQDTLGMKYIDRELLKEQIIKSAAHQFKEGDVLHWWHEETGKGIRTRFSDDLLWLPYAILEYIDFTGDYDILKLEVPYLQGEVLKEGEDEKYDLYLEESLEKVENEDGEEDDENGYGEGDGYGYGKEEGDGYGEEGEEEDKEGENGNDKVRDKEGNKNKEGEKNKTETEGIRYDNTILGHLVKALERGIQIGKNGFVKIGSGDWNDGFSTVGNKGKGESIWLTFFVYYILQNLMFGDGGFPLKNLTFGDGGFPLKNLTPKLRPQPLKNLTPMLRPQPLKNLTIRDGGLIVENPQKTIEIMLENFRNSLENEAWDGEWFKRAFTDKGESIGSNKNTECKIDCIAQSWSIISNSVSKDKQITAFKSAEKYLIDRENKIIKLLTPAFNKSNLNPGYIRKYINGVRENGGQYTHGSLWLVLAATVLGDNNKAFEYYKMFMPINHSLNKVEADKYMVEPYVIAADIYGEQNLIGKGGWTWYTGASAWFYKIGIENILGLKIKNDRLSINPCVPNEWKEYRIRYMYGNAIYNIEIKRDNTKRFLLNGIEILENEIKLVDNGKINDVEVYF